VSVDLWHGIDLNHLNVYTVRQNLSFCPALRPWWENCRRTKHDNQHFIRVLIMPDRRGVKILARANHFQNPLKCYFIFSSELSKASHLVFITNSPSFWPQGTCYVQTPEGSGRIWIRRDTLRMPIPFPAHTFRVCRVVLQSRLIQRLL